MVQLQRLGPCPVCFTGADESLGISVPGLRLVFVPALCALIPCYLLWEGALVKSFCIQAQHGTIQCKCCACGTFEMKPLSVCAHAPW